MKGEDYPLEDFKNDYAWQHAFHEAVYHEYGPPYDCIGPITHVVRVCCCEEGDNDGPEWLAVVEWSGPEGKFAVMAAGCDYTGWDCQASGTMEFHDSLEIALQDLTPPQAARLDVIHESLIPPGFSREDLVGVGKGIAADWWEENGDLSKAEILREKLFTEENS